MREDWGIIKIGDACSVDYGTRVVQKRDGGKIYPVYGGGGATFSMDTFNREGQIVIARFAMSAQCVRFVKGKFFLNDSGLTISPLDSKKLFQKFLDYQILFLNDSIYSLGRGTAQKNLDVSTFRNLNLVFPKSITEQKRIVEILHKAFTAIDKAKANIEKNLQNAKELFENLTESIFTHKGDNWFDKSLREIADFKNGLNFTKSSKGQVIKIVGVKNFQNNFWVPFDVLESVTIDGKLDATYLLQKNDILTVRSNGNPKLIGRTLLAGNVNGSISHSGFTIRIRLNSKEVFPPYLCHFLKSKKARKELIESGNGVNIKSLNQGALSSLIISIPKSYKEQQIIVERLEELIERSKRLEDLYGKKLKNIEELKKSILQKAFTGELTSEVHLPKVIALPTEKLSIASTDLQAGIISIALQQHLKKSKENTFHHVKAEKIVNMVQYHLQVKLDRKPVKDAAGPNDFPYAKKVESRAAKAGFFTVRKINGVYHYSLGRQTEKLIDKLKTALPEKYSDIVGLIDLMVPMTTQQAELVATVYAAWNNLLIDRINPENEAIVYEARENWHRDKLNIPRDKFFKALDWMKEKHIIPEGIGEKVLSKSA